jgi:uncharacterized protein YqjF (DUF2071 family)
MLNYEVPPGSLAPWVPAGTELDAWRGSTFVSLVAFRFTHTRVLGVAVPFHRDFDEVNLRFYVRRESRGELRRGVVFLRELVPHRAIAAVARAFYNEPYRAVPMRSTIAHDPAPHVSYEWSLGDHWHACSARGAGLEGSLPAPDSLATFITEHYWGYTRQRNGGTVEYHVDHPRWTVWPATDVQASADLSLLSGTLAPFLSAPPRSAFIADGSAVTVFRPQLLPAS